LDYGGKTGRNKSINRPFIRGGRYIYPAYEAEYPNIMRLLDKRLRDLAATKGIEVT
jgi:hypothetical protein